MAIQPIDLQVMFSQVEKVGKAESALKEGAALQRSIAGESEARKLDERLEAVNAADDEGMTENRLQGDGVQKLQDDETDRKKNHRRKRNAYAREDESDFHNSYINDPNLGTLIDLKG
jgi:Arc/MetJ-type ribon-helix-helix transcriptional regulator